MNRTFAAYLACSVLLPAAPAAALPVRISEVLYDAVGSDDGKVFVELFGPAGLDLAGHTLEGVNGANGAVGPVLALSGLIPDDGFFVVADRSGTVTQVANADLLANFDLQNGPDSVLLRDAFGDVIDALGYGLFDPSDVFAGEGFPAPDAPAGHSLARILATLDSDDNAADFEVSSEPSPGSGPVAIPEPSARLLILVAAVTLWAVCRRGP